MFTLGGPGVVERESWAGRREMGDTTGACRGTIRLWRALLERCSRRCFLASTASSQTVCGEWGWGGEASQRKAGLSIS